MQAQQKDDYGNTDFDRLFTEQVFDVNPEIGLARDSEQEPQAATPGRRIKLLTVPVGTSILIHLFLLIVFRQFVPGANPTSPGAEPLSPSIQISFRPRPSPPPAAEPEPEPIQEIAEQEDLPVQPAPESIAANEPFVRESPATESSQLVEQTEQITEAQPRAPKLAAPALPDLRNLIQERAQDNETRRIYSSTNCDERQRRTDLIDCGVEDPSARYNFAAAEENATVEFFAELNLPAEDTSNQLPDRTGGAARTNASQQNMTGNLGANPLIRSVMGEP